MTKSVKKRNFEKEIVAFLEDKSPHPYKAKELARHLKVPQSRYLEFKKILRALSRNGKILRISRNRFCLGQKSPEIVGQLSVNSQGYGFVRRQDGDDIFISQKNMGLALHEDCVRVRLFAASQGLRPEGQVVEVLERARSKIVGTFRQGRRYAYVVPDDIKIQRDIIIANTGHPGALDGQKVVVTIDNWEHEKLNPEGRVIEILGFADEPGVDVLSIVHGYDLNVSFPEVVVSEAKDISVDISNEEYRQRSDLRDIITFTIDPADAKDFDDAVSLQMLENDYLRLGVHIADVSHYVKAGGEIDKEASNRGTSVYLVDRVIPMLPERLSNHLCSLNEGEDKLCMSVLMDLTPSGNIQSFAFKESVIKSRKRLTYEEAQQYIEGKGVDEWVFLLRNMNVLAKKLIAKREQRGSIDFESLEVEIKLDDKGKPVAIKKRERLDSHRMIEEFMLLANETVASYVGKVLREKSEKTIPFVYRIHEKPDRASVEDLLRLGKVFGFTLAPPKRLTPKYFQNISVAIQKHPASVVLQDALLRTMMKAKYSTENVGHFGLAYKFYTHFTSPIRRFPDLMVHRLLKAYCHPDQANVTYDAKKLADLCKIASECEIKAQEAERASVKMKQTEFMERHLGDIFNGVISRIVPFGIFVNLPDFLVDGLVHISDLADDYFIFSEDNYQLVGQHTGKVYRLGESVRVRISRVNRNERLIDFVMVNNAKKPGQSKRRARRQ